MAKKTSTAPNLNELANQAAANKQNETPPTPPQEEKKMYSQEDVDKLLKEKLAENETSLLKKVQGMLDKKPEPSKPEVQQVVMAAPDFGDEELTYVKEMEELFEKVGVGKKTLVFKSKEFKRLVIPPEHTVISGNNTIRLLATRSHASPFVHHHPKDDDWTPHIDPIHFHKPKDKDYGQLIIPKGRVCLQKYMLCFSEYGKKYYLEDKERDARSEMKLLMRKEELRTQLRKAFDAENDMELRIMAIGMMNETEAVTASKELLFVSLQKSLDVNMDLYEREALAKENIYKLVFVKGLKSGDIEVNSRGIYFKKQEVCSLVETEDMYSTFTRACRGNQNLFDRIRSTVL